MNWKVVIVEDEDLLRNGLRKVIPWEQFGFTVVGEADNGKEGLELILDLHPEVVLTDIRMAQMDGLTMAEKIHEWDPRIRIVFISGYDEFDYARRALKVGAVEYILKPIQIEQVEKILKELNDGLNAENSVLLEYRKLKNLEEQYHNEREAAKVQYAEECERIADVKNESEDSLNFTNYNKENLVRAVTGGNQEEIEREWEKLYEELGNRKVISHMHLILIVTSIFESLVKASAYVKEEVQEVQGKPMEHYHRIISKGRRAEILAELKEYSLNLGRCFAKSHPQASLNRAIQFMNQEYGNEGLLMADVARYAYISPSYLSMLLKKETGKTFIEYLTNIRMEYARQLLQDTDMKNYEIAQACGFANATYFSTVFKNIYGESPTSFRSSFRKNDEK